MPPRHANERSGTGPRVVRDHEPGGTRSQVHHLTKYGASGAGIWVLAVALAVVVKVLSELFRTPPE